MTDIRAFQSSLTAACWSSLATLASRLSALPLCFAGSHRLSSSPLLSCRAVFSAVMSLMLTRGAGSRSAAVAQLTRVLLPAACRPSLLSARSHPAALLAVLRPASTAATVSAISCSSASARSRLLLSHRCSPSLCLLSVFGLCVPPLRCAGRRRRAGGGFFRQHF